MYSLTPEHKELLPVWANKWIANALNTAPMDDSERTIMRHAIFGLYAAADLPAPKNIVFVPSPFVLRFAAGVACWRWYQRHNNQQVSTNLGSDAVSMAVSEAMRETPQDPKVNNTIIDRACDSFADLGYSAPKLPMKAGKRLSKEKLNHWYHFNVPTWIDENEKKCAMKASNMWQGGNQWSAYDCYLTFFRHIAKLDLPIYQKYRYWEAAAIHGGPRIMHKDFCMISDRPSLIKINDQNRPHCDDGPFAEWRDGSKLYAVGGVHVPGWVIEYPETISFKAIKDEQNVEVKRIMIEKMGWPKYLEQADAKVIHHRKNEIEGTKESLMDVPGHDMRILVCVCPSTGKIFSLAVPKATKTCEEAQNHLSSGLSPRTVSAS